jgi:predicted Rossmann fold flavoprotein
MAEKPITLAARYWARLVDGLGINADAVWSQMSTQTLMAMAREVTEARFLVAGKGVFKEEFVTSGGVRLSEIDFRTMQSKIAPGLYLAGEVLDIDGVTGGFNFQSAWTTGWIAGSHMI